MLKRQDRQGVKSPADIERKYNQFSRKVGVDDKGKTDNIITELEVHTGKRKTNIKGGEIYVEAPYKVYGEGFSQEYPLIHFKGSDGKRYALFVYGNVDNDAGSFDFQGIRVKTVEGDE